MKILNTPLENRIGVEIINKLQNSGGLYISDLLAKEKVKFQ